MQRNRFTIYDAMEKNGYFEANSANSTSRDPTTGEARYLGPVEFPKMLYHPEGEEKITVPAEHITTPFGPKAVGEQRELLHMIVANSAEEQTALGDGWHNHPAKAVRRRVELFIEASPEISEKEKVKLLAAIPAISSEARVKELERELARLTANQPGAESPAQPGLPLQPLASANTLGARFAATNPPL